jgi:integrase
MLCRGNARRGSIQPETCYLRASGTAKTALPAPYKVEKDVRQPDGTFRSISESFDTLAAAKKGVKDLDRKIAANLEREPTSLGATTTLAQFREEVGQRALATGLAKSTFQDYQRAWKIRIEPELGRYQLGHITRDKIEDCIHEWRETAAPSTVCSALSYLSQLLEKACDKELIEKNPMARVKRPKSKHSSHVRERALKPEQQVQLLSLLEDVTPHYRWFVQTLLYTGLRFSEAAALQADDIELSQGFLHVRRAFQNDGTGHLELGPTKGKKMREAPIPDALVPSLRGALAGKSGQTLLLTNPSGSIFRGSNLRRDLSWKSLAEEIGKPELCFHDLRHTAATNMLDNGVAPHDVRSILGHYSLAVTDIYTGSQSGYASRAALTLS